MRHEVEAVCARSDLERVRVEVVGVLRQNLQLANVSAFEDLVRKYVKRG